MDFSTFNIFFLKLFCTFCHLCTFGYLSTIYFVWLAWLYLHCCFQGIWYDSYIVRKQNKILILTNLEHCVSLVIQYKRVNFVIMTVWAHHGLPIQSLHLRMQPLLLLVPTPYLAPRLDLLMFRNICVTSHVPTSFEPPSSSWEVIDLLVGPTGAVVQGLILGIVRVMILVVEAAVVFGGSIES